MQTYLQRLQALPPLVGHRPDGTPIEDSSGIAISERGHFFLLADAAAEVERITDMLPKGIEVIGPVAEPDQSGYVLADGDKRKRYLLTIAGHTYELGKVVGLISTIPGTAVQYYGLKGTLKPTEAQDTSGVYLTFILSPDTQLPAPPPADVPPYPASPGHVWVRVLTGWAEAPANPSGRSEADIQAILKAVEKALRG